MSAPLSIIIPTLNATDSIGPCLSSLSGGLMEGLIRELIIVDGGSRDAIADVADMIGARLLTTDPGRGGQLRAGAEVATGDWLLFLHADTVLPSEWPDSLRTHIETSPRNAACFSLGFDTGGVMAWLTAGWANLRTSLFALPYGDQTLLVPVGLYARVGGYPDQPLMEDVALVRKLGRSRLSRLPGRVTTSAARYRREGWLRRGTRNMMTLVLYFAGVRPEKLVAWYRG